MDPNEIAGQLHELSDTGFAEVMVMLDKMNVLRRKSRNV